MKSFPSQLSRRHWADVRFVEDTGQRTMTTRTYKLLLEKQKEHAELTQAFQQMGYRFTLDNFIVVCVNIKRLTDTFRSRDREMRGQAVMQYEDFIGLALGAHK